MAEDSLFWDGTSVGHALSTDVWSAPYSSLEFSDLFSVLLGSDAARAYVIPGVGNNLSFQANSPAAMSVLVNTGRVFLRGKLYANTAQKTLTVTTADATNPRLDRIILRITFATQTVQAAILAGTPAGSPSLPSLTQTTDTYELSLGYIYVGQGVTTITNLEIHDERTFAPNFESIRLSAGTQNLIRNSEFLCPVGAYAPAGWSLVLSPSISTTTKPAQMVRGNALSITCDGAANEGVQQTFSVKASTAYSIKMLFNLTAGDRATITVTDNGSTPATITKTLRRSGSWIEELFYYTTPSDASTMTFQIVGVNDTGNVQIGQVLAIEGYVPGPFRAIDPGASCVLLQDVELSSASGTVLLSLPTSGFKHIKIVISGRTTLAATSNTITVRLNADGTANYDCGSVFYNGTSWTDNEQFATSTPSLVELPGANAPVNVRGGVELYLPDYLEATFYEAAYAKSSEIIATSAPGFRIRYATMRRRTAAAITSVTFVCDSANFVAGTRFTIYGLN